jgi:hypothetical protein
VNNNAIQNGHETPGIIRYSAPSNSNSNTTAELGQQYSSSSNQQFFDFFGAQQWPMAATFPVADSQRQQTNSHQHSSPLLNGQNHHHQNDLENAAANLTNCLGGGLDAINAAAVVPIQDIAGIQVFHLLYFICI